METVVSAADRPAAEEQRRAEPSAGPVTPRLTWGSQPMAQAPRCWPGHKAKKSAPDRVHYWYLVRAILPSVWIPSGHHERRRNTGSFHHSARGGRRHLTPPAFSGCLWSETLGFPWQRRQRQVQSVATCLCLCGNRAGSFRACAWRSSTCWPGSAPCFDNV